MGKISIGDSIIYDDTQGGQSNTISFRSYTKEIEISSGTSITLKMPDDIIQGDLLILVVYNRSSLTNPSGWTQGAYYGPFGDFSQRNYIFHKIADGTEAGQNITILQGASGRFAAAIMCFECIGSPQIVFSTTNYSSAGLATIPTITQEDNMLIVAVGSIALTNTGGLTRHLINSPNFSNLQFPTIDIPRILYGFCNYKGYLSGEIVSTFTSTNQTAITILGIKV